jgi:hypothetical protein
MEIFPPIIETPPSEELVMVVALINPSEEMKERREEDQEQVEKDESGELRLLPWKVHSEREKWEQEERWMAGDN